jgi:uncharacterized protein YecA (UPF0149 family)
MPKKQKTKLVEINDIKIRQHSEKKDIIHEQLLKLNIELNLLIKNKDNSLLELKNIYLSNDNKKNLLQYHEKLIDDKKKTIKLLHEDYDLYEKKICYRNKLKQLKS